MKIEQVTIIEGTTTTTTTTVICESCCTCPTCYLLAVALVIVAGLALVAWMRTK